MRSSLRQTGLRGVLSEGDRVSALVALSAICSVSQTLSFDPRNRKRRCDTRTEFGRLMMPPPEGIRVLGPAEAPVARLKSEYRYQLLIKASKRSVLRSIITKLRHYSLEQGWPSTAVVIDVDPLTLM